MIANNFILTGLLGWPVAHSKSPSMHNAAFAAAGLPGYYALFPTPPHRLNEAVAGLRALGIRGANVTVPHKQAVVPFLDALTPEAQAIGAVNTIIIKEEQLVGTNTDAWGFWRDLEDLGITDALTTEENALVLGAGGSARAVAYALATHGISTHILARRLSQAQQLITALKPHLSHPHRLQAHSWTDLPAWASAARLIVNCTPVGMAPHINHSPWPHTLPLHPGQMVYDLVYNPPLTSLMAQAQNAGALAWNGLGMLVYQGARSWELWTGRAAPIAAMRAAIT